MEVIEGLETITGRLRRGSWKHAGQQWHPLSLCGVVARGRRGELRSTRPSVYTVIDHIRPDIIVSLHFNTQYRFKLLEYNLIRENDVII